MDRMSTAERKPSGPKFPGYWKGTDPASKAKDKMVGSAEESIIKDLNKVSKEKVTEWKLSEEYKRFKEQTQPYTGIDPIVRQRLGMPPASLDDVVDYTVNNPPYIRTGDGTPLKTNDGKPVLSGGEFDILKDVKNYYDNRKNKSSNNEESAEVAIKLGYDIKQFVMDGVYITENYRERTPSFDGKIKSIDRKQEFYDKARSLGQQEVTNFAKELIKKQSNP